MVGRVCKTNYTFEAQVENYKARLVAKGFFQQEGMDYTKTFASVACMVSISIVLALASRRGQEVHQIDVLSAFINGDL